MPRGQYDRSKLAKPFRHSEEVQVKPKTPVEMAGADSSACVEEVLDVPRSDDRRMPISEAPKNGDTILLYSEPCPIGVKGRWRKTRKFIAGRWVVNNYWSCPLTNKGLGDHWTLWERIA